MTSKPCGKRNLEGADVHLKAPTFTKKVRVQQENDLYIGGMKDPVKSISHIPKWEVVGARCAVVLNRFLDTHEDAQLSPQRG